MGRPEDPAGRNYSDFASRGVAVVDDVIYAATVDARLVSCSSRRQLLRSFRLTRPDRFDCRASTEARMGRRVRCHVAACHLSRPRDRGFICRGQQPRSHGVRRGARVDRRSGRCAGHFTLCRKRRAGGANTWARITVDDANGLVFLPTGSPSPDYFGGLRPGDNRHANAVVVLRATRARSCGPFRPSTTISGTTTSRRRRCSSREKKERRWLSVRRPATSFFSSVSPADRSSRFASVRFRPAT